MAKLIRYAALAFALSSIAATPAAATTGIDTTSSGSIHITFAGDPARGCETVGVCGYHGTMDTGFDTPTERWFGGAELQLNPATVRVTRTDGAGNGTCGDQAVTFAGVDIEPSGSRVHVSFASGSGGPPLTAGLCAGPRDVPLPAIAARTVSAAQGRAGVTISLNGTGTFAEGPFNGTTEVALRVHFKTKQTTAPSIPNPPRLLEHLAELELGVRATAPATTLPFTFGARDSPFCDEIDSCGLSGTLALTTAPIAQAITFHVYGPWPKGRRLSVAAAVAAMRRGDLLVSDSAKLSAATTTAETASRSGAPACSDTASNRLTGIGALSEGPSDTLIEVGGPPLSDALRTRCPGPGNAIVGGLDSAVAGLLSSLVPTASLLSGQPVTLDLGLGDGVAAGGYTLTGGTLPLTLTPTGMRARSG
jgi:hypothetical protein